MKYTFPWFTLQYCHICRLDGFNFIVISFKYLEYYAEDKIIIIKLRLFKTTTKSKLKFELALRVCVYLY